MPTFVEITNIPSGAYTEYYMPEGRADGRYRVFDGEAEALAAIERLEAAMAARPDDFPTDMEARLLPAGFSSEVLYFIGDGAEILGAYATEGEADEAYQDMQADGTECFPPYPQVLITDTDFPFELAAAKKAGLR